MSDAVGGASPDRPKDCSGGAAFFDVDGTIVSTHIVHQYVFVRRHLTRSGGAPARLRHAVWEGLFYLRCLEYLYLDRISRTRMNIAFYRNYAGLRGDRVRAAAADCFEHVLKPHVFAQAVENIGAHFRAGRRVVLVTGSIDFLIEPLVSHLAATTGGARVDLVARALEERDGCFTGRLDGPPIGGQTKALEVRRYAAREGIDLTRSHAYGDSIADLPMLELVGQPCAVNADRLLAAAARQRQWPCLEWRLSRNGA